MGMVTTSWIRVTYNNELELHIILKAPSVIYFVVPVNETSVRKLHLPQRTLQTISLCSAMTIVKKDYSRSSGCEETI